MVFEVERELFNPGNELGYAITGIVFLAIGVFFIVIFPHPFMLVVGLPLFFGFAFMYLNEGFYRTPNKIRIVKEGLEFSFRSRDSRQIPWQDVLKIEIPTSDPTTFFGRSISQAKLRVKGEETPFYLRIPPAMSILEAKREAESSFGRINQPTDGL